MNWICKIFGHSFGGFVMKIEEGELIIPPIYEIPPSGRLGVYKRCRRCGKNYGATWWGIISQSSNTECEE